MTQPFEPGCGYELNPAVAIRPEPFGALANRYRAHVRVGDLAR